MKHLTAAALVAAMLAPPARANDCNWLEQSFWDTAPAGRVAACIAAGADVAARDEKGKTPLHRAAARGRTEVVRALLDAGADIRARTKDGKLPADLAEDNEAVRNDPVYWVLNEARFD
ncbi:MAG: ankyrin repeat domain-containing protein [Rhodobacteraceae bacterium]|nr:ankyrin repeat domain-containing protein [Paracoccaceae bacterium]